MRPGVVLIIASLALVLSFWPGAAQADGSFFLSVEPEELEWGQSVRLDGSAWPEGDVQISARFLSERFQPDGWDISSDARGDFSFQRVIAFDDISALPQQPAPGWIEITVLVGENEVHRSLVVTADGRRPPGAGYISGSVHDLPPPPRSFFIIWAPIDDSAAYNFVGVPDSGQYETLYISEGKWFVGLYDLSEQRHAAGPDLTTITAYSKELGKLITLTGRVVTAGPGEAVEGVDFTVVEGPAPVAEATRIARPPAPTSVAPAPTVAPAPEMSASSSNGWLAPALLGGGSGLLLAVVGTMRLAAWRRD